MIKKKTIEFNLVSEEMAIIRGKIIFVNNYILDFRELVSEEHTDYRFHFMRPFFYPIHVTQPYRNNEKFTIAEELSRKGMYLPSSSGLKEEEIRYISNVIKEM